RGQPKRVANAMAHSPQLGGVGVEARCPHGTWGPSSGGARHAPNSRCGSLSALFSIAQLSCSDLSFQAGDQGERPVANPQARDREPSFGPTRGVAITLASHTGAQRVTQSAIRREPSNTQRTGMLSWSNSPWASSHLPTPHAVSSELANRSRTSR